MAVLISLLRGINLGPRHKIKMDDLRELYVSLGLENPRTYIQSGNVIFRTDRENLAKLTKFINDSIAGRYGFRADVVLRTLPELRELSKTNKFADRLVDPSKNLVIFLSEALASEASAAVCAVCAGPEELYSDGRHLFGYFPNGMGRSKLPMAIERVLKNRQVTGTARNWNTVLRLIEMAEAEESDGGRGAKLPACR